MANAMAAFAKKLKERLTIPFNAKGKLLVTEGGNLAARPTVKTVGFVETAEELSLQQSQTESFDVVFNQWQRFSRTTSSNNTTGDPWSTEAMPSELGSWSYDAATDSISCTINSASYIGFVSNQRYNNYMLEARLNSTSGDDDEIGLCIAYATDAAGRTHTLEAYRQFRGKAPLMITKNRAVYQVEIAAVSEGLTWADGSVAAGTVGNGSLVGWSAVSTGVLLKITREDDIITIETSQPDASVYHEPAKTVIDLSSDPELEVFRGPQRYGYCCHSQPNSTWEVLDRVSGGRDPIVDMRDYTLYTHDGTGWVSQPSTLAELVADGVVSPKWLHVNPTTGRFYYHDGAGSLRKV